MEKLSLAEVRHRKDKRRRRGWTVVIGPEVRELRNEENLLMCGCLCVRVVGDVVTIVYHHLCLIQSANDKCRHPEEICASDNNQQLFSIST
ncbi:hypothetical protein PV326_013283 [Microctonus aethiopoides]|nr:hypothetical protein PV326_013283 [Microctonus aethiopoides]